MSEYFACCPCQICNEESQIICFCSRVNLCLNCLPVHLQQELSKKHKPMPLENPSLYLDEAESQRKQVFSSIISRLQNEILYIEEFKRLAFQQISDSLSSIRAEVDRFSESSLKQLDDLCSSAVDELRGALSLSKLSLNVNHPVLDLFKHCRTADDVKSVQVLTKDLAFDSVNILSLLQNHVKLSLVINKHKSRTFPAKSPAEQGENAEKSLVIRHISNISLASATNSRNDSFSSVFTSSAASPETTGGHARYTKIWEQQVYADTKKFSVEMELQERSSSKIEKSQVFDYRPATIYKISSFSEEIIEINLKTLNKSVFFSQEKFFPNSAWCISEDERLFITGGFDGTARRSVIVFNLKTQKNEKVQFMSQSRFNHSMVSCGKNLYVFAGFCGNPLKTCEKFCLVKKHWKKIGNLAVARENCAACVHFNLIYIFGGNGVESVEMYSPFKKKFVLLSFRLASPGKCLAFAYDDKIVVLQKDKIFLVDTGKNTMLEHSKVLNGNWWTACEPLVTTDFAYFFEGDALIQISVPEFQLSFVDV